MATWKVKSRVLKRYLCMVLIVPFSTIVKLWKQHTGPWTDEWASSMGSTHTTEPQAVLKRKEIWHLLRRGRTWGRYAEWHGPVTKGQILCDSMPMRYLEESNPQRQGRTWFQGLRRRGNGELLFNRQTFNFARWKVLEIDGGDSCTTMWMYLTLWNYTLKDA